MTLEGYSGFLATPVPMEMVFTSREALAFVYGCVAAGSLMRAGSGRGRPAPSAVAVLKIIELEQEVWEGVFRTLTDLCIKRAVESG